MTARRQHKELRRFIKYLAGGSLYFWIGYGVFAVCFSLFSWHWLPAKIAADVIGWTANYVVQRFWTFRDQVHLSESKHVRRYVFIEAIGFGLDYVIIWGLDHVGITPYIGFFVSSAFFTAWSYVWYKKWVFPDRSRQA